MRTCLTIIAMCCVPSAAWSQLVDVLGETRPAPPSDQPKLVQMTVAAQEVPDPALKYQLLPSVADRTPGNAALMYYLARQVMPGIGNETQEQKRRDQINSYLEMPLSDLPEQEVVALLDRYATALRQVEIGAMREDADWGLPLSEGITMVIPSLNDFRQMAKVLSLRARLEIAQGRFDQALRTIQIGMSMGRHVGDGGPTVISSLVGIAIEALMLERVRELIEHGGPNMYWALAGLPEPLVDVRPAFDWERQWLMMSHPEFRKALADPIGPAEGAALLRAMTELFAMATGEPRPGLGVLGQAALASRYYGIGKRVLVERGRSREEVDAMPVGQVVALYILEDYSHWRDELFKWLNLPYWQAKAGLESSQQPFQKWMESGGRLNPLTALVPDLGRAYLMQAKLDRTRAALQTIEAIRIYAAHHDRPPRTLDQLGLPAPIDPVTGRQFQYETEDQSFTLVGPAPHGESAKEGVRYEVRLTPAAQVPTATTAPAAAPPPTLPADGAWQGIEQFIQDDTIAVVQVDLAALTSDAAWQQISTVVQESELGEEVLPILAQVRDMGRQYVQAGAAEAFIVVNITDLPEVPMIVVPLRPDTDADKLAAVLSSSSARSRIQRVDGALVVATDGQLQLLAEAGPAKRPRLMKALDSAGGAVRVAIAFSDDIRRALEETLGTLPPELGSLPGTTITHGLWWVGLGLSVQPEVSLRLVIQSADAAGAEGMSTLVDRAMEATAAQIKKTDPQGAEIFGSLTASLRPNVSGDQLVLQLDQAQIVSLIRSSVGPAIQRARSQARRVISATNIRAIVASCLMWAKDHEGMFPPDLQALVNKKMLTPEIPVNPLRPELGQAGYVYLPPGMPISKLEDGQIVAYEAHEQFGDGVNVGFADGHVKLIVDETRFKALLERAEADKTTSRPATQPASP